MKSAAQWHGWEMAGQRRMAVGALVVGSLLMGQSSVADAEEALAGAAPGATNEAPSTLPALLASAPSSAKPAASALTRAMDALEAWQDALADVKRLRSEQDAVKTEVIGVSGELEIVTRNQEQLEQQLQTLEQKRQEQLEALHKELETGLQGQLSQTRQQLTAELGRDVTNRIQAFQARQHELIEQHVNQQLRLQEEEIAQLSDEVEAQARELADRLGRLRTGSELAKSVEAAAKRLVKQRRVELDDRRGQLGAERTALVAKRSEEFAVKLKQQHDQELQSRLVMKEAGLRQAMAELLHQSDAQEAKFVEQVERQLQEVRKHRAQLTNRQAMLNARLQTLERDIASAHQHVETLEGKRQLTLVDVHEALQKTPGSQQADTLAWFNEAIQGVPTELATELGLIKQRVVAQVEQARQLAEQRRVLRERQMAMQLSHEMERRYLDTQRQRQREQEARARKADELIARAKDAAGRGQFDQALTLLNQAQALNPPQASTVVLVQEDILAEKRHAERQAKLTQIEKLFANAMQAFNNGRYEEAVNLFEQVVAREAELGVTTHQNEVATALSGGP